MVTSDVTWCEKKLKIYVVVSLRLSKLVLAMPGKKSRTIRRSKRRPPVGKAAESEKATREPTVSSRNDSTPSLPTTPATTVATGHDSAPSTSTSTPVLTATAKKLAKSPYLSLPEQSNEESELKMYDEFEGKV